MRSAITSTLLIWAACGPSSLAGDEAGSTTAVDSESSTTNEIDETGDEPDAELCEGSTIEVSLTGSTAPPQTCESIAFAGSLVEQIDASTWALDSCGCDRDCEAPDPHELTITLDAAGIEIPPLPPCLEIDLERNDACDTTSVVVREAGGEFVWAVGSWDATIPGFSWMTNQAIETTPCSDDTNPVIEGRRLAVEGLDSGVIVGPEEVVTIMGYEIRNASTLTYSGVEPGELNLHYFIIPQ
ncbi:hypothetical protein [Enhygromyxa salina]|uniref:Uncharacterized protein n=1 Tax=Enhygromyxa salina TaxID=215803 RepID=A0A2S9XLH1_9BACT|nr:hypothetical protein [Enhygromyxa salina]PRP93719.1 hypothetical protein ENSA7_81470 [Enhygromyxa salina]